MKRAWIVLALIVASACSEDTALTHDGGGRAMPKIGGTGPYVIGGRFDQSDFDCWLTVAFADGTWTRMAVTRARCGAALQWTTR